MRRLSLAALVALAFAAPAAGAVQISGLDTSAYPQVRLSVVASQPLSTLPALTENGLAVTDLKGVNLSNGKSVVLAIDRSQSMVGDSIRNATAAARAFVDQKPGADRIAIVAFGHHAAALTGFSPAARRLRPDPRRDQGRLGVRDRALRRRRLGGRAARQERDRGPRDHPAHRRARRLELGDARRGRRRRPRRARGHLPDRDRFARLRPCSPPAARAANERDVPPRQLERGAALRVHLDRRRARPYLAARLRDRRAPGRPRRPGDDDLGRQRPDVARDPGELRDRLGVGPLVAPAVAPVLHRRDDRVRAADGAARPRRRPLRRGRRARELGQGPARTAHRRARAPPDAPEGAPLAARRALQGDRVGVRELAALGLARADARARGRAASPRRVHLGEPRPGLPARHDRRQSPVPRRS